MLRGIRLIFGGLAILAAAGGEAQSQYYYPFGYGYGGYGFGGWGATPQGSIAQGLGVYAAGAGVYNVDTAQARSINTDTVIRYNQYIYNSMLEARRRYNREHARKLAMDDAHYNARLARIRDNPTAEDIVSGDALNAILDQLSDPKMLHGSELRLASAKLDAQSIKAIPFRDETDAYSIALDQLTDPNSWPFPRRSDAFKAEREAYQKAVDDALAEDREGTIKPETVARVRNAVAALYQKVEATIPKTQQPDHLQATNYLKGLAGLSKMLEKPNVEGVLAELEKIQTTTIGNLVAFMHAYNLRFDPATTPKQRSVYQELYPMLADARDKMIGKPSDPVANNAPPPPVENPTALFHGMDPTHLNPPPPPTPAKP
jgi:hypothetical protein